MIESETSCDEIGAIVSKFDVRPLVDGFDASPASSSGSCYVVKHSGGVFNMEKSAR